MEIRTIGFTKHSAGEFFGKLRDADVDRLIDVRINNVSQLAGFAKRDDLRWFLAELCNVEYRHEPLLAPTKELLKAYRDGHIGWEEYERRFFDLLVERRIEERISPTDLGARPVLLCSEHEPDHCHRRLVVEYLDDRWGGVTIEHL